MNTKIAWIVQECPSALLPLAIVWTGGENILTQMDMKAKILGTSTPFTMPCFSNVLIIIGIRVLHIEI